MSYGGENHFIASQYIYIFLLGYGTIMPFFNLILDFISYNTHGGSCNDLIL
jgi:hypothetical protein